MTDITHTPHEAVALDDSVLSRFASYVTSIASNQATLDDWAATFIDTKDAEAYAAYILAVPGTDEYRDPIHEFGSDYVGSDDTWNQAVNSLTLFGFLNTPLTEHDLAEAREVFTLDLPAWAEQTVRRSIEQQCHIIRTTSGRVHLFRRRP